MATPLVLRSPWFQEAALEIDFPTLEWWWNLVGLPVLLGIASAVAFARGRDVSVVIRRLGLVHLVLASRAGVALVQELLTLRVMGIPQSFPVTGILWPFVTLVVDLLLARGLWRRTPRARRGALVWQTLQAVLAVPVVWFFWRYSVPVEPADWADHLVSKGFPFVILGLLWNRRVAGGFTLEGEPDHAPARGLALISICLVVVAGSTLAVDLVDWLVRLIQG